MSVKPPSGPEASVQADGLAEFQRMLAQLPTAAYMCDAEGLITYFNAKAVELWGREPKRNDRRERFCGSHKIINLDGSPLRHDQCWMARAIRDDRTYDGQEVVIERPDGSRSTVRAHPSPLHDAAGKVVGALNVMVDVTDRRKAEETRSYLAAIVDSSDDAIISKNLDGIIQSWNTAAQRLFGYTAEEAVGRHVSILIPVDRSDEEDRIIARLRAGERVYHYDTVRVRSDGRRIDVSLTISPIRDDAGRLIGASKIVRDIADRKKAEQQVYELLTQLKETDRRKDEFLATLAHELRSPLAPLTACLEILKRGCRGDASVRTSMETMDRQLGQMVRLVDDLLDVSRVTSNKLQLRRERVELASVIGQAVEVSRPLAAAAKHELSVTLPAEPVYLHADRDRLAQVFGNLLTNACRYTDPGGHIRVTAERHNGSVTVTVADDGIGIPPAKLSAVFEMFAQVQPDAERARGGLGIGLRVVKRLVELHGGTVHATSDGPGRGSAFVVRLPAVPQGPAPEPAGPPSDLTQPVGGRRVLVVDDNADSATSLAVLLELSGHTTATAFDGPSAVAEAERFRPDVVLLDISLPKFDGHEVALRIRNLPWGKGVTIIALTGWAQEEDRRRSAAAGIDHHMVKPVDYEALTRLLLPR
jgi:PAS domain S-box-containing protein